MPSLNVIPEGKMCEPLPMAVNLMSAFCCVSNSCYIPLTALKWSPQ